MYSFIILPIKLTSKFEKVKEYEKTLRYKVLFEMIIALIIEGFLDIFYITIISLYVNQREPFVEHLSYLLAAFCATVSILICLKYVFVILKDLWILFKYGKYK